jgi:hypothetical protein
VTENLVEIGGRMKAIGGGAAITAAMRRLASKFVAAGGRVPPSSKMLVLFCQRNRRCIYLVSFNLYVFR